MSDGDRNKAWRADGKFFRSGPSRVRLRAVTYGPFPGGWPEGMEGGFRRIAEAGFNAVRLFTMPPRRLLDEAAECGLKVFGGLMWGQNADFFRNPGLLTAARVALVEGLRETRDHPAMAGVFVGNEIPTDLVRWMGPLRVRNAIEDLIDLGRQHAPHSMFAYANYPSTEYLEPENADFTAFNVYLEDPDAYRKYLKRLHHIAGDRPLVISEFGLDSRRNGLEKQAEVLAWADQISLEEECAGFAVYAWSDRWWNNDAEVLDWDFGITDREGRDKPALTKLGESPIVSPIAPLRFSVIICTRNGRSRIGACLDAVRRMEGSFETIVVDDGSEDGTAEFVEETYPWVRVLKLDPCGLSAARNEGAAFSKGDVLAFTDDDCEPDREWLVRLERVFADGRFAAAGGPNLPPGPRTWEEAVVCAAPGAPSHVMLDDEEAEHLPGCNIAVTQAAFDAVGGFDSQFQTAGDDVDFCWRLRAAGFRLGFAPGAFVWHWRRPSIRAFLRQQTGYGRAERLLIAKHPTKFSKLGGAIWQGFVYGGGAVRVMADSIIYHGPMGAAGYQAVINRMLPLRGLDRRFDHWFSRLALRAVIFLVPRLRAWERNRACFCPAFAGFKASHQARPDEEFAIPDCSREDFLRSLIESGWMPGGPTDAWDARKNQTRVLAATGYGKGGSRHTLVRIWGDPGLLGWSL